MNRQVLVEELKGRFNSIGNVIIGNIEDRNNISDINSIRLRLFEPSNVEVHLCNFEKLYPDVIIDVNDHNSLQYSLNTSFDQVINDANNYYPNMVDELNDIHQFVEIIWDAFLVSFAFDSAASNFNQYYGTQQRNIDLLRIAYRQLCQYKIYSKNCLTLLNAIITEASRKNIELN